MTGAFDYVIHLEEGDQRYIQLEFKVPLTAPANLTVENLQRAAAAFEKALHL